MADLTIGNETFRVAVSGKATRPALMLSNPLGTDLCAWDTQMAAFTEHFHVIRYDTRGHGGSVGAGTPVSIAQLGADAIAILDALEIDDVHWLGLSMGGAVGLWLLTNAPARIARAVLANTAPKIGTTDSWNARIASVLSGGMHDNAKATIERWFSPSYAEREPDRVAIVHQMLRSTSPQGYAICCAALRDMDLRAAMPSIKQEVLVVTGLGDSIISAEDQAAFISSIPGATHVALDARHMSNIEAEEAFNVAVIDFLTAKPPLKELRHKASATKSAIRGGASRRSDAARRPLTKMPTKRAAIKKRRPASSTARKPVKPIAGRRPQAQKSATRTDARKSAKSPPKKTKPSKSPLSRRAPLLAAARTPIKKVKARPAPAKATAKKTLKKPVGTLRRRRSKSPRRPSGRRKT